MEDLKIEAVARVMSAAIKPFDYGEKGIGEVVAIKATGVWGEHRWPISVHVTTYPGCGAIPVTGDDVKITVERV